jgi:geranylgeranyl diphosphate synthase type II
MLIHLIERSTDAERERLRIFLGRPRETRTDEDVAWVLERMENYGSLHYARQVSQGLAGAAQYEFKDLYGHLPESRDKSFLEALPVWVIERN